MLDDQHAESNRVPCRAWVSEQQPDPGVQGSAPEAHVRYWANCSQGFRAGPFAARFTADEIARKHQFDGSPS